MFGPHTKINAINTERVFKQQYNKPKLLKQLLLNFFFKLIIFFCQKN